MQKCRFSLEIKALSDDGRLEGYASVFGNVDRGDDIVVKGAFEQSIEEFKEANDFPPLLWQHDTSRPLGPITDLAEDDVGLQLKADMLMDLGQAKDARLLIKNKVVKGLSIGFRPRPGGSLFRDDGVRILSDLELFEVSLVTLPMNPLTTVSVKNLFSELATDETPAPKQIERILREAGFSRSEAKALMAKGYAGLFPREAEAEQATLDSAIQLLEVLKNA